MKKIFFLFLLSFSLLSKAQVNTTPTYLVGPMLHFNFGNGENHFSFGLEGSAWLLDSNFPIPPSIDFGFEYEKGKFRVYSEFQTGALIGLSAGPVIEFSDEDPRFGFQSSVWASFLAGVDFRYRRMNGGNYFAPGLFFKLPLNINQTLSGF
jgi:hypothetical protein